MASIRNRNGNLFLDFYYQGERQRLQTTLADTASNRKKIQKLADKIAEEISLGTFELSRYLPNSRRAKAAEERPMNTAIKAVAAAVAGVSYPTAGNDEILDATPLFKDFAEVWFAEKSVEWRQSHREQIRMDLDKNILPRFGQMAVGRITKAHVLSFRADLAKVQARGKTAVLSNPRINKLLAPLRMILNEAADRFEFRTPFTNIKQLKIRKTDVQPLSLDEVKRILTQVRADYRPYFTTRFFTGMRTGEADGLKWKYVDFERRLILVRETYVDGRTEYTKTESPRESRRPFGLSQAVEACSV